MCVRTGAPELAVIAMHEVVNELLVRPEGVSVLHLSLNVTLNSKSTTLTTPALVTLNHL